MPLPESGPLSLGMIRDEYGGGNPASLNQYYAGGGLVPANAEGINGPIPSAGTIDFEVFYGSPRFVYSMTAGAGNDGASIWRRGVQTITSPPAIGPFGSISPATLNGANIDIISDQFPAAPVNPPASLVIGLGSNVPQTFWTSMAIAGGSTFLSANADIFLPGASPIWVFNNPGINFLPAQNYTITFALP